MGPMLDAGTMDTYGRIDLEVSTYFFAIKEQ